MRVVLDVNILASAAVSPTRLPAVVVDMILDGPHELILSDTMLATLERVLRERYFASRLSQWQRTETVDRYRRYALEYEPDPLITGVADDEEDDRVLGTAVAGRAEIVVTGDKGLLAIGSFMGIPIVTARTFLDLIDP